MKKILRMKFSNNRIVGFAVIIGLFVISLSGCQQVNDAVNKVANINTTTNSNATANTNANSNVTANSNANTNTSSVLPTNSAANTNSQANNTATATREEVPLTEEAKIFKNNLVGEWIDNLGSKHKFTEDKYEFNVGTSSSNKGSYKVVNENTLDLVASDGEKWNAIMEIGGDVNTLTWKQSNGDIFKFQRVNPK